MSDGTAIELRLVLEQGEDSHPAELDALTRRLRNRLLELDVHRVEADRSGTVPPGAKPGEVISLGALLVVAAPFALRGVVRLVQSWLENRPVRTVTLTVGGDSIEVQHLSSAEQRRLIEAFVAAHGERRPPGPPPLPGPGPDPSPGPGPGPDPGPVPGTGAGA
ncbi:effector-associated constant component EACC1 [Streptomyces sp. NPDC003691]